MRNLIIAAVAGPAPQAPRLPTSEGARVWAVLRLTLSSALLFTLSCGPTERTQVERALVGRGRVIVVGDAEWTQLRPSGTELRALATQPPLAAALADANEREGPERLIAAMQAGGVQGLLVDVASAEQLRGLAQRLARFGRVPGLQGAFLNRGAALYVLDPVRSWSPELRTGLAQVARRLIGGTPPPRIASFPPAVRKLEPVEVMVLLRSGDQPRLWRSARGSSFARALLTATAVARQRWIERSAALGGRLDVLLPTLTVELSLLQDDGEIGTRAESFVDTVTSKEHGVGYERKGGWHYLLPDATHKGGRKPSQAYRQLFRDDGLPAESLGDADLRLYRVAVQHIGESEAAPEPKLPDDGLSDVKAPGEVLER